MPAAHTTFVYSASVAQKPARRPRTEFDDTVRTCHRSEAENAAQDAVERSPGGLLHRRRGPVGDGKTLGGAPYRDVAMGLTEIFFPAHGWRFVSSGVVAAPPPQ